MSSYLEAELRRASQTLEERVVARTAELTLLTEELHVRIAEQQSCDVALEASQQGISDFIENAAIGMHWVDIEGNIVWVNQAELNMFGYDRSQYISQPLISFHVDRAKLTDLLQRVSRNESIRGCEAQVYCKDGSICDVSIDAHAFFSDGKFIHARCFTRNITDQKRAESVAQTTLTSLQFQKYALDRSAIVAATDRDGTIISVNDKTSRKQAEESVRQRELKFRAIFDNTFQFVGLLDTAGTILEANRTALVAIGATPADVIGQAFWATPWWTHSPDLQVQLQQGVEQAATGELVRFEAKHFLADGSFVIVDFSLSPIFDDTGKVVMLIPEWRDITARKQIESARQESEARFRALLMAAPVGIFQADVAGNNLFFNQQCLELMGLESSPNEILGLDAAINTLHPDDREWVLAQWLSAVQAKQEFAAECRFLTPQGRLNWVFVNAISIDEESGSLSGYIGTVMDITERKRMETALQESEARYLALLTTAPVGIYQTDAVGNSIFVNQRCLELLGVPLAEILGQGWANSLHPDDRESVFAEWYRAVQAEQEFTSEHRFLTPQGRVNWVFSKAIGIYDETGTVTGYIGTITDITERKQLERDRERFLTVAADLQLILGSNGYFQWVSPRWESTLGWTAAEMTSRQWTEFVHPDDIAPSVAEETSLFDGHELMAFENRYRHKDGSYRWFSWNAQPVPEERTIYAVAVDITDRKAAAQKIQEQAALLNIATDAIIVRDLDRRIQFWSNGAESIYGWTAAEAIGIRAERLFCPDIPLEAVGAFNIVQEQGAWQGELHKLTKAGKAVVVESRWTLVRDEAGNPRSILSVDTDITEKKSLEQQFLRAQRLESLGSLASGIAHDLNNVLTPIVGAAQLLPLTLPNLDDRNRRLLNMLVESSKRGSGLVKQILTFARGMDGERTTLQARHILTEIVSVARHTFPKSIEIQVNHASEDLWMVSVDATQIHQVLMNLFVNARDAMPNGGSLTASTENIIIDADYVARHGQPPVGAYILMTIADTGIGMTSEMLDRIFDPFFTTKETGTGLGLSTVQGIVKAHGGAIEVESQIGQGTSFKIYLPAIDRQEAEASAAAADLYDGKGQLVLVVDDESAIREIAQESLENYNYRVMLASDGIEAIDIYAQNHHSIAFVLVDMMMPHLDTRSTILALQQINPQVQIVVMSGSALNLEDLVDPPREGLHQRSPVRAFLTKPFTTANLLQTLAEIQIESSR